MRLTVALLGMILYGGCGGAQLAEPMDARVAEVRRLAAADLRCDEARLQIAPIVAFSECERREAETIDDESGERSGPMGRCLAWSEERTSWPFDGWTASGCGFAEQYLDACGAVGLARRVVPGTIDCATF